MGIGGHSTLPQSDLSDPPGRSGPHHFPEHVRGQVAAQQALQSRAASPLLCVVGELALPPPAPRALGQVLGISRNLRLRGAAGGPAATGMRRAPGWHRCACSRANGQEPRRFCKAVRRKRSLQRESRLLCCTEEPYPRVARGPQTSRARLQAAGPPDCSHQHPSVSDRTAHPAPLQVFSRGRVRTAAGRHTCGGLPPSGNQNQTVMARRAGERGCSGHPSRWKGPPGLCLLPKPWGQPQLMWSGRAMGPRGTQDQGDA